MANSQELEFIPDISVRYFQISHRHLPTISRIRFNNHITFGAAPAADFSVLLLTLCLITYAPAFGYQSEHGATTTVEKQTIYLTVRSLLAEIQVSHSPSVTLVQAGLLLALYEYTNGRPDDAFVTFAGTARIAYATGMHHQSQILCADADVLLRAEEAANTWWGVVILERVFFSEITVSDQPLITIFPGANARLPIEPQLLDQLDISKPESLTNIPLSRLTSPNLGGFSRTAQATSLLDQVLKAFNTLDLDSKLLQLERLDTEIQSFLSLLLPKCQDQPVFCMAIHITIKTLFTLHTHILTHPPSQSPITNSKPFSEKHNKSRETLNTITKMVIDIAESLCVSERMLDGMPPMYPYIARAALRYIESEAGMEDGGWLERGGEVLRGSLGRYFGRWGVSGDFGGRG